MFGDRFKEDTDNFVTPEVVPAPAAEKSLDGHVAQIKNFNTGDELILTDVNGDDYNKLNTMFSSERNAGKFRFEHDQDSCTLKVIDGDG